MPLKNLTPMPCIALDARTPGGGVKGVVIVKATLDLVPAGAEFRTRGHTHLLRFAQEQRPLAFTDGYSGTFQASSLLWESDLAPTKPRCDVIVLGAAHAPGGAPRRQFQAGLRLSTAERSRPLPVPPRPLDPWMAPTPGQERAWQEACAWARAHAIPGETILDKRLRVTGTRWLKRRNPLSRILRWVLKASSLGLVRPCPWKLTRPRPVAAVPLAYEYSFGGHVRINPSDPAFRRVPRKHWLPGAERQALAQSAKAGEGDGILAEAWWDENPVGRGYAPAWALKAARLKRLPAPQIEDPEHPFTAKAALAAGRERRPIPPCLLPQGMGVVNKRWAGRLRHAGTWSESWNQSGAPYFPGFNESFWNAAHPGLQSRPLEGDEVFELTNLCPPQTPGLDRAPGGDRVMRFPLPGMMPYVILGFPSGELGYAPAILDTVVIEPGEARVTLVHRASFSHDPEPQDLELGFILFGAQWRTPGEAGYGDPEGAHA